ncbi:fructose-specific PTS transporter subunit EIIC [Fundicoccus culcitae]|uniref:Fructose-specific PTS transporter subunit EIIC n=1 Tax=Fundicoccus culcitae TaxID=2969821 RepID=A0ABY5P1Y7_9LACT|nr:fructose-specific PTS transporter subunit EIIC [Fundicoccus culcitae]UUX32723.1 fructose-specific PTS transporter subunit EIIC [Fundicoccus culcitae]
MSKKVIAITACPVGVAHTYMAAENLERKGKEMGIDIKVETHGSIGIENQLTQEDINEAEGLIIASDKDIDKSRFNGKRIIEVPVRQGIDNPEKLIQDILDGKGKIQGGQAAVKQSEASEKAGNTVYKALMNGVSYMVPFVVTGGLLIAVALSIGGTPTEAGFVIPEGTFWANVNAIGGAAMSFMVPILAGYIAYAIADRPGLVPGVVGGYIAANGSFYGSEANTGFIGGIIAGFLAGYVAKAIKKIPFPKAFNSIIPIIIIPVFSTLIVGLVFIYLIGQPVASLFSIMTDWLAGMQGANSVILATIIGAMIAVDMGGPFNKTAFLFGSGLIAEGVFNVMGAVAVAVCIPPIAVGIASHMFKKKFSEADRQAGTAAIIMGFFGITEGAIPFAAKNPTRIIPAIMGGSIVGSIIAMLSGVGGHVAHGGPIVALLGAIDNVFMYFVAVIVGVAVTIALLAVLVPDMEPELAVIDNAALTNDLDQGNTSEAVVVNETQVEANEISLTDLMTEELIIMNVQSTNKADAFKEFISLPVVGERISDQEAVLAAINKRESEGSTGMGEGIAIPHAKSDKIIVPTVVFGRSEQGIEWESIDGQPVNVAFLILVPQKHQGDMHLKILQILARKLMDPTFKENLLAATTKEEVYNILKEVK